ncbi:MAG: MFS transporter [Coxiellaceae bacterium]|jgi:MFS family permease|nr:MFS transporter [Coxiellaceae bacterium]
MKIKILPFLSRFDTLPCKGDTELMKIKNTTLGWIICFLAAIFYCYEYLLRVAPSVMILELMQSFKVSATEFGILTAVFYFVYTPMQLIVGPLSDLYGARRILILAIISCTVGSYLFSIAHILVVAAIGRALIGFGSAFAFVCILKLTDSWLPRRFFALFVGIATALGMIGAIFQVTVLGSLVHDIGWKSTIHIGTIVGIILIPVIWLVVRDNPDDVTIIKPQYRNFFFDFLSILKNPQMWLNGFIGCIMYLSLSAFAESWGTRSLTVIYNLSPFDARYSCALVFVGWLIGSPFVGYVSDVCHSRKIPLLIGSFFATILISLIIYCPHNNISLLFWLLFLFGFFSSCEILCFAISSENTTKNMIATASAFTNFVVMISGMASQPLIGKILDLTWTGKMLHGVRIYSLINYQLALTVLPVGFFLGFILIFWLRETGNKVSV